MIWNREKNCSIKNKLEESLVIFNRIVAAGQGGDDAKRMAGIVSLRLEKYDQAIDHFTNLEKSPSTPTPENLPMPLP